MSVNEPQFSAEKAGIESEGINLESVTQLFSAIDTYNQENSSEAIIFKAITTSVKASLPPPETDSAISTLCDELTIGIETKEKMEYFKKHKKIPFNSPEERINFKNSINAQKIILEGYFNIISEFYEKQLNQLGLSIETINGEVAISFNDGFLNNEDRINTTDFGVFASPEEIVFEQSKIVYNIFDGKKIISFFNGLNPETINNNLKNMLLNIIESLVNQQVSESKENIIPQLLSQYERLNTNSVLRFMYPSF
jgi:hypothetical protein